MAGRSAFRPFPAKTARVKIGNQPLDPKFHSAHYSFKNARKNVHVCNRICYVLPPPPAQSVKTDARATPPSNVTCRCSSLESDASACCTVARKPFEQVPHMIMCLCLCSHWLLSLSPAAPRSSGGHRRGVCESTKSISPPFCPVPCWRDACVNAR